GHGPVDEELLDLGPYVRRPGRARGADRAGRAGTPAGAARRGWGEGNGAARLSGALGRSWGAVGGGGAPPPPDGQPARAGRGGGAERGGWAEVGGGRSEGRTPATVPG